MAVLPATPAPAWPTEDAYAAAPGLEDDGVMMGFL
jgi:hypothetical protein